MSGSAENMSGYFRTFFEKHPHQVHKRKNDAAIAQWLADHPGQKTIPDNAYIALQNVKGQLRKNKKKGKPGRPKGSTTASAPAAKTIQISPKLLHTLEDRLDDCLGYIRAEAGDGLAKVIGHLKAARRAVIIMGGE